MTRFSALPDFYDNLDLSLDKAWQVIEAGAAKRTSPGHVPTVGTEGHDGSPQLRILVLREGDRRNRRLRFHTDCRSTKVDELGFSSAASVLIYDPVEKIQLRLTCCTRFEFDGADVDTAWQQSTTFAWRCYMAVTAPGSDSVGPSSGLPKFIESKQPTYLPTYLPTEVELIGARQNFAILWLEVVSLEWLYLANAGHRRARWRWDEADEDWSGNWLVP